MKLHLKKDMSRAGWWRLLVNWTTAFNASGITPEKYEHSEVESEKLTNQFYVLY